MKCNRVPVGLLTDIGRLNKRVTHPEHFFNLLVELFILPSFVLIEQPLFVVLVHISLDA